MQYEHLKGMIPFLLVLVAALAGCSGSSAGGRPGTEVSSMTELSATEQNLSAGSGGTIVSGEFTAVVPAGALPADSTLRVSTVSVSNTTQDPSIGDVTGTYVFSTSSSTVPLELSASADVAFRVNPGGFDESSIRVVFWDGRVWQEVPATYDPASQTVSTTLESILPFGTRIYYADAASASPVHHGRTGRKTITEFLAMKVVAEQSAGASAVRAGEMTTSAAATARALYVRSANFTVKYTRVEDQALATALSGYLENAYATIVVQMGLKRPGKSAVPGCENTWPVVLAELGDAYGRADDTNFIEIQEGSTPDDDLAHTCHHEFFHLVQYKTLRDAGNNSTDGLSWFDETTADGIGFYAQKGLGVMYSAADADMGYFQARLDDDDDVSNEDYQYVHFPFISYILAQYGTARFKTFFETYYSYTPGKQRINMTTIDTAANAGLGKPVAGRDGIYWDFYRDYLISGTVFNKTKFLNLPDRSSGGPLEITDDNAGGQGATLVDVRPAAAIAAKDFTLLRLSGQAAVFRYAGAAGTSVTLTVSVRSTPGQSNGRIQLVAFKRVGGVLQPVGITEEVSEGGQKQVAYANFGTDIHAVYVVMANTASQTDDYKVTVNASGS